MRKVIPVIDLFSGPGGLSEGFSRFGQQNWTAELSDELSDSAWEPPANRVFHISQSIEKDPIARQTLRLRAFFRQFESSQVPDDYYKLLRGQMTEIELFSKFPHQAEESGREAWCATLGEEPESNLDRRISQALGSAEEWCLLGGPPCQAYSLAGRSRNKGIVGYRAEDDSRHFLYRQYLRIVAKHRPPVFVMENVKGLLSSKIEGESIFDRILDDLRAPDVAIGGRDAGLRYELVPFVVTAGDLSGRDNRRFILRAEKLGVPQARHRVILFGIRSDLRSTLSSIPQLSERKPVSLSAVLDGLPKLRGSVSKVDAGAEGERWLATIRGVLGEVWLKDLSSSDPAVAAKILDSVVKARSPRHRRGGIFVPAEVSSGYAPSWFSDPRIGGVCNHEARSHMPEDLERYLFAACFARVHQHSPDLADFPRALLPKHKNANKAAKDGALFSDRFRVQLRNRPATTVTSHISKDGHYYIHPDPLQCRSLTVREAARLQTFPDNYFFCGPRTEQFHQVGNAVPPLLAVQLAAAVAKVLG